MRKYAIRITLALEPTDNWQHLLGLTTADASSRAREILIIEFYREGSLSRVNRHAQDLSLWLAWIAAGASLADLVGWLGGDTRHRARQGSSPATISVIRGNTIYRFAGFDRGEAEVVEM